MTAAIIGMEGAGGLAVDPATGAAPAPREASAIVCDATCPEVAAGRLASGLPALFAPPLPPLPPKDNAPASKAIKDRISHFFRLNGLNRMFAVRDMPRPTTSLILISRMISSP
jgi:hypothetical protein